MDVDEKLTALKRRLLSAGACSFLCAHAGAVVTSAAGHVDVGEGDRAV